MNECSLQKALIFKILWIKKMHKGHISGAGKIKKLEDDKAGKN